MLGQPTAEGCSSQRWHQVDGLGTVMKSSVHVINFVFLAIIFASSDLVIDHFLDIFSVNELTLKRSMHCEMHRKLVHCTPLFPDSLWRTVYSTESSCTYREVPAPALALVGLERTPVPYLPYTVRCTRIEHLHYAGVIKTRRQARRPRSGGLPNPTSNCAVPRVVYLVYGVFASVRLLVRPVPQFVSLTSRCERWDALLARVTSVVGLAIFVLV